MVRAWEDVWKDFKGLNWFGRRLKEKQLEVIEEVVDIIKLPADAKIIDVGCGGGYTLSMFRNLGFKKSWGFDHSSEALKVCKEHCGFIEGKDVFKDELLKRRVMKRRFDMVFSGGLIEHYKNTTPIVGAMCRLSKKWILIMQPNWDSLFSKIKYRLGSQEWEKEYYYNKKDYEKMFKNFGFKLVKSGLLNWNEVMWLLFKRVRE